MQITNSHLLTIAVEDNPLPLREDDQKVAFNGYHLGDETLEDTLLDKIVKKANSRRLTKEMKIDGRK